MPADKRADHPGTSTAAASDAGLAPAVDSLPDSRPTLSANGHDFLVGGITLAAILLMVGSGTSWLRSTLGSSDMAGASHQAISATLLLNIALIMFGWRRFRELRAEVARRTAAEERAQALAWHDPLTGFLNRRALSDQAPERIAGWRAQGKSIGALVIDVDAFKSVNDLFGHAGGDTVLQTIAVRMAAIAPAGSMLARLGGDEFTVVFALDAGSEASIDDIGEAMTAALSQSVQIDELLAPTSSSIGGSIAVDAETSLEALLRHADSAMYQAKRLGRCRYCRFDSVMESDLAERDTIERELRMAISAGSLFPVYEPLIDLSTGEPIGYEMLARWTSEALGEVAPTQFIAVAEEKGLISSLSDLLFRRAFNEAAMWPAHLSLSVNVSPLQLRDPWFSQKLLKLLAETGFPAQRLVIEITESAIVDNLPLAQAVFTSLRNQGIRMALDDFGTGYSSIASLRALPFDSVKIDREFIARMSEGDGTNSIAEAVLKLGHSLGLPVVAEGIESSDTAARLSSLACAIGQGHYYGEALTGDMVRQRHNPTSPDKRRRA